MYYDNSFNNYDNYDNSFNNITYIQSLNPQLGQNNNKTCSLSYKGVVVSVEKRIKSRR